MHCSTDDRRQLETLLASNQELSVLQARLDTLDEREKLEQLKAEQIKARNEQVRNRAAGNEHRTDVFRLRQEVAKLKERERDDRATLSTATDREQRRDLKHDLSTTLAKLEDFEDRLERAIRTAEFFDGNESEQPDAYQAAIREAEENVQRAENALRADMDAAAARVQAARELLNDEVLAAYDRGVEEQGIGAAWLKGRMCQGCFMELDPASLKSIQRTPADELPQCPECNVLLLVYREEE